MHIFSFRLSIFGDYKSFTPTTDNIITWTQALKSAGYSFLPNIIQTTQAVINVPFVPMAPLQINPNDQRLQFVSQNGDSNIRILSDRIDVELAQGLCDDPKLFFTEKLLYIVQLMKTILTALGEVRGNRLAYFTDALLPEPKEGSFESFYQSNNMEIIIKSHPDTCVEWNHRFNRRVNLDVANKNELCNAIFIMESGIIQTFNTQTGEQQTTKGLHFSSDINTLAENKEVRFDASSFDDFSSNAQDLFLDVLQQIQKKLL